MAHRRGTIITGLAAVAAGLAAGNLMVLALVHRARRRGRGAAPPGVSDISNVFIVDHHLWRGGAPTPEGYRSLAAAGVRTVIDLRAEGGGAPPEETGMTAVRFPVRDGQPPSPLQIDAINTAIREAAGPVFIHCAAGVGRTGSAVAAYLRLERGATTGEALHSMLSVGPPSLEQIAFVGALGTDRAHRAPPALTVLSRILDAPRRTWSRVRGLLAGRH